MFCVWSRRAAGAFFELFRVTSYVKAFGYLFIEASNRQSAFLERRAWSLKNKKLTSGFELSGFSFCIFAENIEFWSVSLIWDLGEPTWKRQSARTWRESGAKVAPRVQVSKILGTRLNAPEPHSASTVWKINLYIIRIWVSNTNERNIFV